MGDDAHTRCAELVQRLPHREPFVFLSRVVAFNPGHEAIGQWAVTGSEDFLRGHFPSRPIVPGVLIAEALAQLAGLTLDVPPDQDHVLALLAHADVRFERSVEPPATIRLHARTQRRIGQLQQFEVQADVDGETIARGTLILAQKAM